jgi:hypothetical protein
VIQNPNYLTDTYTEFTSLGHRKRELIKRAEGDNRPIPKNDRNGEMCPAFHIRGMCNTNNCQRAADHVDHSKTETARLVAWCRPCFAAMAARA